jgi:shikimate dehydrogenase
MVDGHGFVGAVRAKGFDPVGKRALLIGAGGAGSAIAHALLATGVRELALYDADTSRRDALIARLNSMGAARAIPGSMDPTGFDFVGNATPAGMRAKDPLPIDVAKLVPSMFVGCVITVPSVPPMIEAARARGCLTSTGTDMYQASEATMVDFLIPRANRR